MNRLVIYVVLILVFLCQTETARSEWYLSGYGGYSVAQPLADASMNSYGERLAANRYLFGTANIQQGDTLTQNFSTSDLSLKQSVLFGGKGGYFFSDQGLPWLGVELEAFTTTPTIKTQTLTTTQDITFIKANPNPGCPLPVPPFNQCSRQETVNSTLSLTQSSLRLVTVIFNVVARYPGTTFQPYIGIGGGAFYFSSSGEDQFDSLGRIIGYGINGRQVVPGLNAQAGLKVLATEELGVFVEGKYNYATITNLDPVGLGLSGTYSAFNLLAGIAYHF